MPTVDVQLEPEDYVKAAVATSALTWKGRSLIAAVLIVIAVAAGLLAAYTEDIHIAIVICGASFGAVGGMLLVKWMMLPGQCRRVFDQTPTLQRPSQITWDERTLTSISQYGTVTFPWAEFHKTRELGEHFLVFFSEVMMLIIPKRAFTDEATLQNFRECIQTHVQPRTRD